ncbi:zinc finger protein OZF-like [Tribolium castaneum]|uniref:Zinc finger protein 782-like Protein n=1 Tax=Tribolium castaneum TaxID=7070 RepID=A0A139WHT0_TRICA|nr:Zinc finger protein 782-like Protein [Tribolium castaneum]
MDKKYEKHCRICVKETTNGVYLFDATISDSETYIVDFLRQITNLEISEDDGLTNILCPTCVTKVFDCFDLVQICIASDAILRSAKDTKCDSNKQNSDLIKSEDLNLPKDSEFQCRICKLTFSNKTSLNKHNKSTHKDDNPFKCDQCSQSFRKKMHLNVHQRSHTKDEDKKFFCKSCDKQFMYEYLLRQHEYKHTDEKPFPCSVCNRGCLTAESLRRHMRIHDRNYVKKKHSCEICHKEFPYPSFLAEHMKNHTGEKPHLCSTCGKGFRQSGALHYHQRIHTGDKKFSCTICNGRFMSQSVLKVHMRKHTNERPYVCHICGMAFRQSTDMKSHQRTHSGDKPVLCNICGKRMSTTGQLTIHIRSHTGEKPFSCSNCPKAFTSRAMLVKHERIHTGERPYRCNVCGKAFNQSGTLRTHKKTHECDKKRRKSEKQKEVIEDKAYQSSDAVFFKNEFVNLETEIVTDEFIGSNVQDIEVKTSDGCMKTQLTLILPAPIPLLQNL